MPIAVLGVDPGNTTGLALLSIEAHTPELARVAAEDFETTVSVIRDFVVTSTTGVAVERYTVGPQTLRKTRQPTAMWVIGVVMAVCQWAGVPCELQAPSDAKMAFRDERLHSLGLWTSSPHTRDATRHALLYARRNRLL